MNYTIFKMRFKAAVHIGDKSLTDSEMTIHADTVFSALCHEALKSNEGELEKLVSLSKEGSIIISDALPFIDKDYYIPKPIIHIEGNSESKSGDYGNKKAFKKLKYIPVDLIDPYLNGEFDARYRLEDFAKLGKSDTRTLATIRQETKPYHVGTFTFFDNSGLYVIVGYEKEIDFIESLFNALSYSGIGGRRSSGLGKFEVERCGCEEFISLLNNTAAKKKMTLSVSMAKNEELEGCLVNATYTLKKRSGFVSSATYADRMLKKRDFYAFGAGSCFENTFEGDVFDVSQDGSHPVYRYAKPMFMGVNM